MSTNLHEISELADVLLKLGGVIGLFLGLLLYVKKDREESYQNLNEKYLHFIEIQLSHPGLGTSSCDRDLKELDTDDRIRRDLQFEYLFSILERAYTFLFEGPFKYVPWTATPWKTWDAWIIEYSENPNFQTYWASICENKSFTPGFVTYMNRRVKGRV